MQLQKIFKKFLDVSRKSGEKIDNIHDIDCFDSSNKFSFYSFKDHLSKQNDSNLNHQLFYKKFEKKAYDILDIQSEHRPNELFVFECLPTMEENNNRFKQENEEENKSTKRMIKNLESFVSSLPNKHREKRTGELIQTYQMLMEKTENTSSIQINETGQPTKSIEIPELVQNFSHDFWIHKIKSKLLNGESISDEDLVYLLLIRLKYADVQQNGFVLEDFPENLKQKRILDSHKVTPNLVFLIDGVLDSRNAQLSLYLKQMSYLRFLQTKIKHLDVSS